MKVIPEPMDSVDLMDLELDLKLDYSSCNPYVNPRASKIDLEWEWECRENEISSEKNENSIYDIPESEKNLTFLFNEEI